MADGKILPFLMFQGEAEAAIDAYAALFPDSQVRDVVRNGPENKLFRATLDLAGQTVLIFESPVQHAFGFTPSFSFFVECEDEAEIERYVAALSEGGEFLMPLAAYDFARRFAWLKDRFGISWQFNLA